MEQKAVPGNWGSDVQLLPVQLPSYEMGYGGTTPFYLEAFNLDFDYIDKDTGKRTYPRSFQGMVELYELRESLMLTQKSLGKTCV